MRNAALHRHLEAFTVDASGRLTARVAAGEEIPFEVRDQSGGGAAPLYCYQPLTADYIRAHRQLLAQLPGHPDAVRALGECEALDVYLAAHGEVRIPGDRRGCAELALVVFLGAMFAERSDFGFEPAHFETAYAELEGAVYAGHGTATVIVPVLGVALDPLTTELTLGDGLSLIRGEALAGAPPEAVWGEREEPSVLAVGAVDHARSDRPPISVARADFRRILSALRLLAQGDYALGPLAWVRTEGGGWRTVPSGAGGRVGGTRRLTIVPAGQEEELRAFYRLVARRSTGGELAWALARFEMGCERLVPVQALTDYLLALRALLEPEGPASGRMAQRLAVICAQPDKRAGLAQRTAAAIDLERAVVTGLAQSSQRSERADGLVDELSGHLRAILRDALCGHLDADLCAVADELLADAASAAAR